MKVTQATKDTIADIIADFDPVVNKDIKVGEVLTVLIESGFLDEEYEISDEEGNYDESLDGLVQAYVEGEIRRQLATLH